MNKIWITMTLLVLGLAPVQAQDEIAGAREQIEAFRVAYYTRELSLSSSEAQRFWPVYNAFTDDLEANRADQRNIQAQLRQAYLSGSDAEVEKLLDNLMDLRREETEISIQYHTLFKEVLPIRKVAMMYKAENDFKRKLLEHLQTRRQERIQNRRP